MIDHRMEEFLALVDCDPSEVRDATNRQIEMDHTAAAQVTDTPEAKARAFGRKPLPYGKFKGTPLEDVPSGYIEWFIASPDGSASTQASRKFKSKVREWYRRKKRPPQ